MLIWNVAYLLHSVFHDLKCKSYLNPALPAQLQVCHLSQTTAHWPLLEPKFISKWQKSSLDCSSQGLQKSQSVHPGTLALSSNPMGASRSRQLFPSQLHLNEDKINTEFKMSGVAYPVEN